MRFGSGPTACWGASRTPISDAKQQEDDLEAIDQAPFNFDPRIGLLLGIMVAFLVFAVATGRIIFLCSRIGLLRNR